MDMTRYLYKITVYNIGEGNGRSLLGESRRWNRGDYSFVHILLPPQLLRSVVGSISRSTQLPCTITIINNGNTLLYIARQRNFVWRLSWVAKNINHLLFHIQFDCWVSPPTSKWLLLLLLGLMECSQICVHRIYGLSPFVQSFDQWTWDWMTDGQTLIRANVVTRGNSNGTLLWFLHYFYYYKSCGPYFRFLNISIFNDPTN